MADWRDGEMLLQTLIVGPEQVQRASAHQQQLEQLVVAEGLAAAFAEPVAETLAVIVVVGRGRPGLVLEAAHAPLRWGRRPFGESVKIS